MLKHFEKDENDDTVRKCKIENCGKRIKYTRGSMKGCSVHLKMHEKKFENGPRIEMDRYITADMVGALNVAANKFDTKSIKLLYRLAGLGHISAKRAKEICDEEAM